MTAPAVSWGLFGRGAHEAGRVRLPEQAGPERVPGEEPGLPEPVSAVPSALADDVAGPAERALLEASRELGGLHPLDRAEQADRVEAPPTASTGPVEADGPVPSDVPWAAPPVLDVLPTAGRRRRTARDAVLPLVLLGELLTGVWLGTAKPWQAAAPDPLQARFASTAPASDDVRLPERLHAPVLPGGAVLTTGAEAPAPPSASASVAPSPTWEPARAGDPFRPR